MGVNKSVLEKMSSKELEKYISVESKFVPDAIEYAFEILDTRKKYSFTEEQLERWKQLKVEKEQSAISEEIHPEYKKAANLWYISVGLGLINFLFTDANDLFFGIITIILLFGLGYMISKGFEWIKYLLLGMFILGFLISIFSFILYVNNSIVTIINIIQTILQIWVLVILFRIPKNV